MKTESTSTNAPQNYELYVCSYSLVIGKPL